MRFVSTGIGDEVRDALTGAREVAIAVAYFRPDDQTMGLLRKARSLKLIVSEEFTVTNPHQLRQLSQGSVHSVPTDDPHGKLHSKVIVIRRKDGSRWAYVGSANMTNQGMFSNQEAGVVLDPIADAAAFGVMQQWFTQLWARSSRPDLVAACEIFDNQAHYQLVRRPTGTTTVTPGYYVLKTTEGDNGPNHWLDFVREGVVAIGWTNVRRDPLRMTNPQLDVVVGPAARRLIRHFQNMPNDSLALICRGYAPNQRSRVHVYGIARVTGPFYMDPRPRWNWRFKRSAVIQPIYQDVARATIARALALHGSRLTIHNLDRPPIQGLGQQKFNNLMRAIGVQVQV